MHHVNSEITVCSAVIKLSSVSELPVIDRNFKPALTSVISQCQMLPSALSITASCSPPPLAAAPAVVARGTHQAVEGIASASLGSRTSRMG